MTRRGRDERVTTARTIERELGAFLADVRARAAQDARAQLLAELERGVLATWELRATSLERFNTYQEAGQETRTCVEDLRATLARQGGTR